MKIHKTINPVAVQNTYYLESDTHLIVVDPGSDWNKIHDKIEQIGKPITAILLTHTHYDHIMSLDILRETYHFPPVYVAESEASWLYTPEMNLSGLPLMTIWKMSFANPQNKSFSLKKNTNLMDFIL